MGAFSKKLLGAVAGVALAFGATGTATADVPESERPIVIPMHNWTGATINAAVTGQILEDMGYNVEYVTIGFLAAAQGIADGDVTYSPEVWDNNLGELYPKLIAEGKVVDLGDVGIDAREGWLYPKHVEKLCPGLPDWDAFIGCAGIFSTAETFPNGRYLDYPAEWRSRGGDLVREEGLPFEVVPAGSEGALIAELNSSVERQSALVMMFWAPHWSLFAHDVEWVNMPQDLVEKYSLQKPRVFKAGWPGMADEWPIATRFIESFRIGNADQEYMMGLIDNDGEDLMAVTREWIDSNPDTWQPYVDKAMMSGS
ncbi:MAG: ABC transporter substrate-binding protein [Rhodospirillales bacterium]|nr:ABC transporter substrate-binding protein [Rhodospirillales bacterium]